MRREERILVGSFSITTLPCCHGLRRMSPYAFQSALTHSSAIKNNLPTLPRQTFGIIHGKARFTILRFYGLLIFILNVPPLRPCFYLIFIYKGHATTYLLLQPRGLWFMAFELAPLSSFIARVLSTWGSLCANSCSKVLKATLLHVPPAIILNVSTDLLGVGILDNVTCQRNYVNRHKLGKVVAEWRRLH